jgi:hypothetical protein
VKQHFLHKIEALAHACDQLPSHCEGQGSLYTLRRPSGTWQVGNLTVKSFAILEAGFILIIDLIRFKPMLTVNILKPIVLIANNPRIFSLNS